MVMIDETEGIEFDSDGRGCSVTLLTEDGQSLRGLADRAGIWTELEERHPGLTPERILQGDHAVFGCIVIHDNLRAHGEFGMEFDGDAAFDRFELTDVELNMLGKKLPRLADTDELKAFFSHAGGGGGRLTQSERSTAYGRHEPDANTVSDISEYLKDALTEYRNAPSWMRRDPCPMIQSKTSSATCDPDTAPRPPGSTPRKSTEASKSNPRTCPSCSATPANSTTNSNNTTRLPTSMILTTS